VVEIITKDILVGVLQLLLLN